MSTETTTKTKHRLKAPYPWFGGKSRVASIVWERLGDCDNYIEPFLGSAAVLLARPHDARVETVNDWNHLLTNFWRAIKNEPEVVAEYADQPVNEANLHAMHQFLVGGPGHREFRRRMYNDIHYYDAERAGYWVAGICMWIGSGWCAAADLDFVAEIPNQIPVLSVENGISTGDKMPGRTSGVAQKGKRRKQKATGQLPEMVSNRGVTGKMPEMTSNRGILNQINEKIPQLSNTFGGVGVHNEVQEKIPLIGHASGGSGIHVVAVPEQIPEIGHASGGKGIHVVQGTVDAAIPDKRPEMRAHPTGNHGRGVTATGGNGNAEATRGLAAEDLTEGRPQLADAFSRGRGVHGNDKAGTCAQRRAWLLNWFRLLADRFRTVRVCCGHWRRVCDSESTTTRLGVTAIFLDPPYPTHLEDGESRKGTLYGSHDTADNTIKIRDEVLAYAIEHGGDKMFRICIAAYEGDGYEVLVEKYGWDVVEWRAQGGYGNRTEKGQANRHRERLFFSPHCIKPEEEHPLFAAAGLLDKSHFEEEDLWSAAPPSPASSEISSLSSSPSSHSSSADSCSAASASSPKAASPSPAPVPPPASAPASASAPPASVTEEDRWILATESENSSSTSSTSLDSEAPLLPSESSSSPSSDLCSGSTSIVSLTEEDSWLPVMTDVGAVVSPPSSPSSAPSSSSTGSSEASQSESSSPKDRSRSSSPKSDDEDVQDLAALFAATDHLVPAEEPDEWTTDMTISSSTSSAASPATSSAPSSSPAPSEGDADAGPVRPAPPRESPPPTEAELDWWFGSV